jgi:hypothetical protein
MQSISTGPWRNRNHFRVQRRSRTCSLDRFRTLPKRIPTPQKANAAGQSPNPSSPILKTPRLAPANRELGSQYLCVSPPEKTRTGTDCSSGQRSSAHPQRRNPAPGHTPFLRVLPAQSPRKPCSPLPQPPFQELMLKQSKLNPSIMSF